jgi:hypothetical protein
MVGWRLSLCLIGDHERFQFVARSLMDPGTFCTEACRISFLIISAESPRLLPIHQQSCVVLSTEAHSDSSNTSVETGQSGFASHV